MRRDRKSFCYSGIILPGTIEPGDVSVRATPVGEWPPFFAGESPTLRFWNDRFILISGPPGESRLKWCAFPAGDAIPRAARVGDRVEAARDVRGGLSICLFRGDRLILAVGALFGLEMGPDVEAYASLEEDDRVADVRIAGERRRLGQRASALMAEYDVYVDFVPPSGGCFCCGGPRESLSIVRIDDPVVLNAARRSAVQMSANPADPHDPLYGERADGTIIRRQHLVDWYDEESES